MATNPMLDRINRTVAAGVQNSPQANSPFAMVMRLIQSGGNPMTMLSQMGGPQAQEAMGLIQGKNPQQLRETAEKMAQERGTSIEAIAQRLGLSLPK